MIPCRVGAGAVWSGVGMLASPWVGHASPFTPDLCWNPFLSALTLGLLA